MARRLTGGGGSSHPRSLLVRILIWLAALLVILLLLSLIFGGIEKGTKVGFGSGRWQRQQSSLQEIALGRVARALDRCPVLVASLTRSAQAAQ